MIHLNSWHFKRLRTLSFPEVAYRVKQLICFYFDKRSIGVKQTNVEYKFISNILPSTLSECLDGTLLLDVFGIRLKVEDIKDWSFDPYTKRTFPKQYSKCINIRTPEYGSAKHVWEINRMLFLPQLAILYRKNGDISYKRKILEVLSSWIDQNPFLIGVNWYSNIEVNIRLINWFLTWEILQVDQLINHDEELKHFVDTEWIPSIYQHCKFSYENPSLYSSANNHLISEYAGLFIASSKWKFKKSAKWNCYSKKGLETEIIKQYSENGINREEAAEYIQFITDFFLLSLIVGDRTNNSFSLEFKSRFKAILNYIHNFLDVKGNFPKYGDEDDGRVFILDKELHHNNFLSLVNTGAVYFNDSSLIANGQELDQKNIILFGTKGKQTFSALGANKGTKQSAIYPREGHFIFRKNQDHNKEIYCHFDAAPLGYLSIAAHGHADALSFILHVDGQPIFVDPGTYCYHTDPIWREYFLSTKAHNTICINKQSQATYVGPTLWLDHYQIAVKECHSTDTYDCVTAEHNGYNKVGIIHRRKLELFKNENKILLTDFIINNSGQEVLIEMPFHLHPNITHELSENELMVEIYDARSVHTILDTKLKWTEAIGKTDYPLGWYSPSFYKKQPTAVIFGSMLSSTSETFKTEIRIN